MATTRKACAGCRVSCRKTRATGRPTQPWRTTMSAPETPFLRPAIASSPSRMEPQGRHFHPAARLERVSRSPRHAQPRPVERPVRLLELSHFNRLVDGHITEHLCGLAGRPGDLERG